MLVNARIHCKLPPWPSEFPSPAQHPNNITLLSKKMPPPGAYSNNIHMHVQISISSSFHSPRQLTCSIHIIIHPVLFYTSHHFSYLSCLLSIQPHQARIVVGSLSSIPGLQLETLTHSAHCWMFLSDSLHTTGSGISHSTHQSGP